MRRTAASLLALTLAMLVACTPSPPHRTAVAAPSPPPGATTPPAPPPSPGNEIGNDQPITHGPRSTNEVALTFDSNLTVFMEHELDTGRVRSFDNTAVVDELHDLTVPATFFLAGLWMLRYPAETRRLAADPLFELGSHSYQHKGFTAHCYGLGSLRPEEMAADVRRSEDVLRRFTPHPTSWFRFPGGCYDATALREIAPTGVRVVQFDVASGDAFGTSVARIVQHTLAATRGGSIVVMHVTGGNTAPLTAEALPAIVRGLRARGFRLVRLTELLQA